MMLLALSYENNTFKELISGNYCRSKDEEYGLNCVGKQHILVKSMISNSNKISRISSEAG